MEDLAQMAQGDLGNTKTKSRKWCLTLNNWTEKELVQLRDHFESKEATYIIGKEVGESGTAHLQCFVEFKNAVYFTALKKLNSRLHIEKARGNNEQNFKYCYKQGDFITNVTIKLSNQERIKNKKLAMYETGTWRPWQQQLIDLCKTEADSRTINWVYDPIGNSGKSYLCTYLNLIYNCVYCDGKKDNVLNQTRIKAIEEDLDIKIILMDIPRHCQEYVNYGLLEQLKNGHIYSGKYEGGEVYLDNVHVIVFSNQLPDLSKFSEDRWNVIHIN